ncbi:kin of IRRE-like protein 2 [Branchiostoma lanceolatum]|uniref:kin of IRRE-like protein 2 n=1 Tax=Branchiostoma lanceolatum TaxID=7740 RepID=UPI003456B633
MWAPRVFVVVLALFPVQKAFASQTPSYQTRPKSTAVRKGETVTLYCSFHRLRNKPVMWLGPPNFQVIASGRDVDVNKYGRHEIVGDARRGEFNLKIRDVRPGDEGDYRCTVFSVPPAKDARITVIVPPPSLPSITGETMELRAGKGLVLTCRSVGGRPLPRLSWYNGTRKFVIPAADEDEGNAPGEVSLTLLVRFLSKWDNKANLTCRSDQGYPDVVRPQQTSAILNVQYSPTAKAELSSVTVTEGQPANLTCHAEGNPRPVVRWKKLAGGMPQNRLERSSTLYIPHTRRRDAAIYQCRAENGIHPAGVSTVSLQVTFPPTIRPSFEEKVSILFGQKLDFSVQCEADGNPSPKVRWRRKGTPLYFDNPLRFSRVGYGEEGHYQCIASSKGFPDAIRETYINVIGKPDVLGEPTSLAVTRGDSVSLVCEVASDPDPKEITWMWRGSDVDGDQQFPVGSDGNVKVRQESYEGGKSVKSVLTIQNTNSGRTGDYVCKAVNMFGSDQRQFSVEIIEPPTTMLAIVVAAVSVVVVLFVLFAICVARRKGWICDEAISDASSTVSCTRSPPPLPPCKENGRKGLKDGELPLELQQVDGTLKPRPPPKGDRNPYAIGQSYPRLMPAVPAYSTIQRDKSREERCPSHAPYYVGRLHSRAEPNTNPSPRRHQAPWRGRPNGRESSPDYTRRARDAGHEHSGTGRTHARDGPHEHPVRSSHNNEGVQHDHKTCTHSRPSTPEFAGRSQNNTRPGTPDYTQRSQNNRPDTPEYTGRSQNNRGSDSYTWRHRGRECAPEYPEINDHRH